MKKKYNEKITLTRNSRGCYILDTVKGCSYCDEGHPHGCYDSCYAKNIADRYGFNFGSIISRRLDNSGDQIYFPGFINESHLNKIIKQIKRAKMPFIRIGEMGDPSYDWEHTINICGAISGAGKSIVIITKHWRVIPQALLDDIRLLDICINTSISAMDTKAERIYRLGQYERLKPYCNSVLRVVTCDFNEDYEEGERLARIQMELLRNNKVIDTVFRPGPNSLLVENRIIKTERKIFLRKKSIVSINNKNAYLGYCESCPDMCGLDLDETGGA
jgi:hypothetical protein